ncbi:MAG: hypothetical protein IK105_09280 [Thermoguttaceae bacterium]|nr:hypothetical protein [Thermoguttaceae bacterium]
MSENSPTYYTLPNYGYNSATVIENRGFVFYTYFDDVTGKLLLDSNENIAARPIPDDGTDLESVIASLNGTPCASWGQCRGVGGVYPLGRKIGENPDITYGKESWNAWDITESVTLVKLYYLVHGRYGQEEERVFLREDGESDEELIQRARDSITVAGTRLCAKYQIDMTADYDNYAILRDPHEYQVGYRDCRYYVDFHSAYYFDRSGWEFVSGNVPVYRVLPRSGSCRIDLEASARYSQEWEFSEYVGSSSTGTILTRLSGALSTIRDAIKSKTVPMIDHGVLGIKDG